MILNLILALSALLIIFGAYRNGIYGAVVTFFATTFASVIAICYYRPLSREVIAEYFYGIERYADAISFMGIFVVVLFILLSLSRLYLSESLSYAKPFDVLASVVIGTLTALIVAGVLAVGYFMLPTRPSSFYSGERVFASVDEKFAGYSARLISRLGCTDFDGGAFLEYYKAKFRGKRPDINKGGPY